jgi:hypothetical protein
VFDDIRSAEIEWKASNREIPFAQYYLHRPKYVQCNRCVPACLVDRIDRCDYQKVQDVYNPPSIPEKIHLPTFLAKAPMAHAACQLKPPDLNPILLQSRIRAAQRIKAYQAKKLQQFSYNKAMYQDLKSKDFAYMHPMVYEKPRPDLVHSRLPALFQLSVR